MVRNSILRVTRPEGCEAVGSEGFKAAGVSARWAANEAANPSITIQAAFDLAELVQTVSAAPCFSAKTPLQLHQRYRPGAETVCNTMNRCFLWRVGYGHLQRLPAWHSVTLILMLWRTAHDFRTSIGARRAEQASEKCNTQGHWPKVILS